jgi:hypothetical protein
MTLPNTILGPRPLTLPAKLKIQCNSDVVVHLMSLSLGVVERLGGEGRGR